MDEEQRQAIYFEGWQALRDACRRVHQAEMEGRAGGAAVCICGAACGGTKACGMLGLIRDFLKYCDAERMRPEDRQILEMMRRFI